MQKKPQKKIRRGRLVPLTAGVLLLGTLYRGGIPLPRDGFRPKDVLARTLLETELGPVWADEPSALAGPDEPRERMQPPVEGDETEEIFVPAADSSCDPPPAEEREASEPEDGGNAVERTMKANGNTVVGSVEVNNSTDHLTVDPDAIAASVLDQTIRPASEGPQILIMHTHATEAYTMAGEDQYKETDYSRTDDPNYNVIRVGDEIQGVLEEMGFSVLHDTTLYDYPSYTGSYTRSLQGVRGILEQNPSISVVLDVHRDALIAEDGTVYKAVTEVEGEKTAQVMLVIGTNDGGLDHPNWQNNLNVAAHIQQGMTAIEPTLARPINLRSQRFNQHLTPASMIVEVGTSGNTLQEALRGAARFARAAGEVYQTMLAE